MFKTCFEPLDLLRVVFDQIHKQTLSASVLQEFNCPFDRNHWRARDRPSFEFIFSRPGETIKVRKLAVSGPQDTCPRRKVLLEDYVFYTGNSFQMLKLTCTTGPISLIVSAHQLYIRLLFASASRLRYLRR